MVAGSKDESTGKAAEFRARLEKLVVKVLARRVTSGSELWEIELALLRLQRDIQAAITDDKDRRRTPEREEIEALREARWHARRFGDALAWILFRGDRRLIDPLAENEVVPITPESHGSRGLIAAAVALSDKFGLPLLHDVTDILRVGDITFFQPGKPPHTVEIKTNVLDAKREGATVTADYRVRAMWPADRPPTPPHRTDDVQHSHRTLAHKASYRQLGRMTKAHLLRSAEAGKPAAIAGEKALIIPGPVDRAPGHWSLLRRLIRRARRTGYASGIAEQANLYAVYHNPAGFRATESPPLERLIEDLGSSGILFEDGAKNSLWISGLPDLRGRGPLRYLPYFLYPIPRMAVLDLLHSRLVIVSILNIGRVVAALDTAGLKVEMRGRRGESSFSVFTEVEVDGDRYPVELANLDSTVTEMVMEVRSVSYVVEMFEAMADGASAQLPELLRERRDDK